MLFVQKESSISQKTASKKSNHRLLLLAELSTYEKRPAFFKTDIDQYIFIRKSTSNAQIFPWSHYGNNH